MYARSNGHLERQWRSCAALVSVFQSPRVGRRAIVVLLIAQSCLLAYSAYVHSPTQIEPAHLVAGLRHLTVGRFDVYNVNPPLVRMIAALPVIAVGYDGAYSDPAYNSFGRAEFRMGQEFVKANGRRSYFLFTVARWACIPFSWLGLVVCYLWGRDLYGRPSGVLAAAFWCFEPNILAHASLIGSDAGGTAIGLACSYVFWRWLKQPTWMRTALSGVILGLAELSKTTLIVFYPLWPVLWLMYRLSCNGRPSAEASLCSDRTAGVQIRSGWFNGRIGFDNMVREACMLTVLMSLGILVVNIGYGFEGSFRRLGDIGFSSELLKGNSRALPADMNLFESSAPAMNRPEAVNRFSRSWFGKLAVPLPENYVLGIDTQQKDFEHYGKPSYLGGEWRFGGWWYYYLYAAAIKTPLGLWIIGAIVLLARAVLLSDSAGRSNVLDGCSDAMNASCWSKKGSWYMRVEKSSAGGLRDELVLILPAVAIFATVSAETSFNEHLRYVLPAFPYAFIWLSQITQIRKPRWMYRSWKCLTFGVSWGYITLLWQCCRGWIVPIYSPLLLVFLFCWVFVSSLWTFPHSLSYFNESVGGPLCGHKYLLGSNVDWGQDLIYATEFASARDTAICRPKIIYSGRFNAADVEPQLKTGDYDTALPSPTRQTFQVSDVEAQDSQCAIVSLNLVYGSSCDVLEWFQLNNGDDLEVLRKCRKDPPGERIGYSMLLGRN